MEVFFILQNDRIVLNDSNYRGALVYRTNFDSWLLSRAEDAGSDILEKSEVQKIALNEHYVEVQLKNEEKYSADILVGAFGLVPSLV